jgi:hypothetical protein
VEAGATRARQEGAPMNPDEIKMDEGERLWWERIRARGSLWYLVNKGLLFLIAYPIGGHFVAGWAWEPQLLLEGWVVGLVCGGLVWMRKELRYRFTLDEEGRPLPDGPDE